MGAGAGCDDHQFGLIDANMHRISGIPDTRAYKL
jgi:hypothetical protein